MVSDNNLRLIGLYTVMSLSLTLFDIRVIGCLLSQRRKSRFLFSLYISEKFSYLLICVLSYVSHSVLWGGGGVGALGADCILIFCLFHCLTSS